MTELIISGFEDAQTAFLARAALARVQMDPTLRTQDVAVVTRAESGEVAVHQAVASADRGRDEKTFWESLADVLFSPSPALGNISESASRNLTAVGIRLDALRRLAEGLHPCNSALLALTHEPTSRDRVLGVLHSSRGRTVQMTLTGKETLAPDPKAPA